MILKLFEEVVITIKNWEFVVDWIYGSCKKKMCIMGDSCRGHALLSENTV